MKIKTFMMAAFAAVTIFTTASCEDDVTNVYVNTGTVPEASALKLSVNLDDYAATRAVDTKTAWNANDAIGVTIYNGNTSSSGIYTNSVANTRFTFDGSLWNPERTIALYQSSAYVSAYSPYSADVTDPTAIDVDNTVDWLYAPLASATPVNAGSPMAVINMNHAFAVVKYSLVNNGYTGPGKLTSAEITSNTYGTSASLNSTTGKLTEIKGLTTPMSAQYADGKYVANTGDKQSDMFMVVPVVGNEDVITFKLNIDGQIYTTSMKITLNQGMIYEFPLKITDTGLNFNGNGEGGEGGDGEGNGMVIILPWNTHNLADSNLTATE